MSDTAVDGEATEYANVKARPHEDATLVQEIEQLRTVNRNQDIAIRALRERLFEVEIELINARCTILQNQAAG